MWTRRRIILGPTLGTFPRVYAYSREQNLRKVRKNNVSGSYPKVRYIGEEYPTQATLSLVHLQ